MIVLFYFSIKCLHDLRTGWSNLAAPAGRFRLVRLLLRELGVLVVHLVHQRLVLLERVFIRLGSLMGVNRVFDLWPSRYS